MSTRRKRTSFKINKRAVLFISLFSLLAFFFIKVPPENVFIILFFSAVVSAFVFTLIEAFQWRKSALFGSIMIFFILSLKAFDMLGVAVFAVLIAFATALYFFLHNEKKE